MSQRYISSTLDVSQTEMEDDLLSGSHPFKVMAYKVDTSISGLTVTNGNNQTVEIHIGEREKIGQGTFGYSDESIENQSPSERLEY